MNLMQPPYLKKGDKIGIVAPARKIALEEIQLAIDTFKSWGLEVVLSENLFSSENQFAGSDQQRATDLQAMLNNPSINAIISARGGYGTLRIIDQLDFSNFQKNLKWIIGYSDITVLHAHLQQLGFQSVHATMPLNFGANEEAVESLRATLFGEKVTYNIPFNSFNRFGKASAQLVGGNLSLLYALSGSVSDLNTNGKILFIEDLDEYYYHIDRMMLQLKRSGKLSHLAGLIVGGMTDMKDNAIPFGKSAEEIILDAVKEYDFPVCFNFPAGHINKNLAIIFGKNASIDIGPQKSDFSY